MNIYRFVVRFNQSDPRSAGYLADAHALGFHNLQRLECQDLYFIEANCRRRNVDSWLSNF